MPTSFLIDRDGLVQRVHHGFDAEIAAEVLRDIESLLGGGPGDTR